jgi:hypothetical protein
MHPTRDIAKKEKARATALSHAGNYFLHHLHLPEKQQQCHLTISPGIITPHHKLITRAVELEGILG